MQIVRIVSGFFLCGLISIQLNMAQPVDWTHFRGGQMNGIAEGANLPVQFNDSVNVTWKTEVPGIGWSSPVILNNKIWVTSAPEDGKTRSVVCIDNVSGKIIFDEIIFRHDSVKRKHSLNSHATPTCCVEEGFVYAHFGRYGTACISTTDYKTIWKRDDLKCLHAQGPGSSPIIYKNMLILHVEGTDVQFIIALDKKTGLTIWKTERPKEYYDELEPIGKKAYITPNVIHVNGKDMLISNGSAVLAAYDPETGKELWRIIKGEDTTMAQPIEEDGVVYMFTSNITKEDENKVIELLAVNPDGEGDIESDNIIWKKDFPTLQMQTPMLKDGLLYFIDTKSFLHCLDAKTGESIYKQRVKGKFNASPVLAGEQIYFASTKGKVLVIKTGKEYEVLAENQFTDDEIWATPAVIDNALILRTKKYLYKFEDQ